MTGSATRPTDLSANAASRCPKKASRGDQTDSSSSSSAREHRQTWEPRIHNDAVEAPPSLIPAGTRTLREAVTPGYAFVTSKGEHHNHGGDTHAGRRRSNCTTCSTRLETELGGVQVYEAAGCVRNDDLRSEWEHYLEQTRHHVELVEEALGLSGSIPPPRRPAEKSSAIPAKRWSRRSPSPKPSATAEQAQVVAAECVTLAETKDHLNWELIGEIVKRSPGSPPRRCGPPTKRSRSKRTSISTTSGWARSSGSKDWACRSICLLPRSRRTSRPPSVPPGPSRPAKT